LLKVNGQTCGQAFNNHYERAPMRFSCGGETKHLFVRLSSFDCYFAH
jgi:hypothetical protein